jgi:hypothetical protein
MLASRNGDPGNPDSGPRGDDDTVDCPAVLLRSGRNLSAFPVFAPSEEPISIGRVNPVKIGKSVPYRDIRRGAGSADMKDIIYVY